MRLHASFKLTLLIWRFLIAGMLLALIAPWENRSNPAAAVLVVLIIATLLLFLLEWFVEWRISRDAETWAIRLSGFGRILVGLAYPLVSVLLRLAGEASTRSGFRSHRD